MLDCHNNQPEPLKIFLEPKKNFQNQLESS